MYLATTHTKITNLLSCGFMLCAFVIAQAQTSKVSASIDSTNIKIGEQIKYTITVETDSLNLVNFPEDQTFSPLEMVEALKIDTTKKKDRVTLQRIYALTQFDSGSYTIPPQRIAIDEKPYFTDSFRIKVTDVAVDTTKQKMYDIKPLVQVEKSYSNILKYVLLALLLLAILAALFYWFVLRKKPLTEEEKIALLPPYDRALKQLKELENSRYLIQDEFKKYYSELTDIVRAYLEEDVHISAMESTTDQLIERLELLKDAGELSLDEDTITQFKKVLQTADLVKFAKSKPDMAVAESDRSAVEKIVVKTKEALPEPTEEDLLENEAYIEAYAAEKRKKRIWIAAGILAGLLILGTGVSIAYFGFKTVKDSLFGYPTKELLEKEWVKSHYGVPAIELETPEVLIRKEIAIPEDAKEVIQTNGTFTYGNYLSLFSITVNSTLYKEQIEPDMEAAASAFLGSLEKNGIKNILPKEDEFFTKSGKPGAKIYGTGQYTGDGPMKNKRFKFTGLLFGGKGFTQQVYITWEEEDEYAEQIVERILATVDVKTEM